MLRIGRLHILGGCYREIGQGLERRRVPATNVAKQDFIERLSAGLSELDSQCLAWALMSNHLNYKVMSVPFLYCNFRSASSGSNEYIGLQCGPTS